MNKQSLKRILKTAVPLWLVIVIVLDSFMASALVSYYLAKKEVNKALVQLSKTTQSPEELIEVLRQEVLPSTGYNLSVQWGEIGKQLVESGAIDKAKYEEIFSKGEDGEEEMKYLEGNWDHKMRIDERNSRFMVNTLWALGLANKSKVLDEMKEQYGEETANFASTGGWNLSSKPAMEIYSSKEIVKLTSEQQDLVKSISQNVYRPCCGNHTAFPDCNHGMAALAYIQLAVKAGVSEDQIYKDVLALNSFWFPQNYVEVAAYFDKQGQKWNEVDPKLILSADYSSSQGAQRIKQEIQNLPGFNVQGGGGCST